MSQVKIQGNASGTGVFTVASPNSNNTQTLTLPDTTGTLYVPGTTVSAIQSGTAVASTSGTSIDFTSIPSWVKRITVMFNGVSTNGTSNIQIQVGAGSFTTTGYSCAASNISSGGTPSGANSTTGMLIQGANAATLAISGSFILTNISGTTWTYISVCGRPDAGIPLVGAGISPALSGTLDRVRITTVNGTDTFDAGSINILYE